MISASGASLILQRLPEQAGGKLYAAGYEMSTPAPFLICFIFVI